MGPLVRNKENFFVATSINAWYLHTFDLMHYCGLLKSRTAVSELKMTFILSSCTFRTNLVLALKPVLRGLDYKMN